MKKKPTDRYDTMSIYDELREADAGINIEQPALAKEEKPDKDDKELATSQNVEPVDFKKKPKDKLEHPKDEEVTQPVILSDKSKPGKTMPMKDVKIPEERLYICNDCAKTFRAIRKICTECKGKNVEPVVKESDDDDESDMVEASDKEQLKKKFGKQLKKDVALDAESEVCSYCGGTGKQGQLECDACFGTGEEHEKKQTETKTPRIDPADQFCPECYKEGSIEQVFEEVDAGRDVRWGCSVCGWVGDEPTSGSTVLKDLRMESKTTESFKEQIPGGYATGKSPDDFDQEQIKMGIEIEMEHTDDPEKAKEIAMDHLMEDPEYYTKLKKMEAGACDEEKEPQYVISWKVLDEPTVRRRYINGKSPDDAEKKFKDSLKRDGMPMDQVEITDVKLKEEKELNWTQIDRKIDKGISMMADKGDSVDRVMDQLMSEEEVSTLSQEEWVKVENQIQQFADGLEEKKNESVDIVPNLTCPKCKAKLELVNDWLELAEKTNEGKYDDGRSKMIEALFSLGFRISDEKKLDDGRIQLTFAKPKEEDIVVIMHPGITDEE